jgi:hypothetical protein
MSRIVLVILKYHRQNLYKGKAFTHDKNCVNGSDDLFLEFKGTML